MGYQVREMMALEREIWARVISSVDKQFANIQYRLRTEYECIREQRAPKLNSKKRVGETAFFCR